MGGDLLLLQQLQAMLTKVLTDVKRIRGKIEDGNLHRQCVFEVVDDSLGNFIVRKKKTVSKQCLQWLYIEEKNRSNLDG